MYLIDRRTRLALDAWRIVDAVPDWDDVLRRARTRGEHRRRAFLALAIAEVALAAAVSPALGLVGYVQTALRGSPDRGFVLSARLAGSGLVADFSASMPEVLVVRRGREGRPAPIIFRRLRSQRQPDLRMSLRWRLDVLEGRVDRLSLRATVANQETLQLCASCASDPTGATRVARVPNGFARALFKGRVMVEARTEAGPVLALVRLRR
jgi:hypothetical protein